VSGEPIPQPKDLDDAVVIYVTRYCGYCHMAEALLKRRSLDYRKIDVTHDQQARMWLRDATGQRTVPQIFIKGRSIGGFQELYALDRQGDLI
jgi:glutaredoxin 3